MQDQTLNQDRIPKEVLEARQNQMLQSADVGTWYCDLPFDVLHWDEKTKEHFWLPPDSKVTIETFYERLHPDDRERTKHAIEHSIETHTPYDIEYRTVSPLNGNLKWIRALGSTFYNAEGIPIRFDGIALNITQKKTSSQALEERTRELEVMNELSRVMSTNQLENIVQAVTDACTVLSGAQFGAFFYNLINERGESYTLYTISGVPREMFSKFPMPGNTAVFRPTFEGTRIVRSDDITKDPNYGKNKYGGMPKGHLPVRSYLAVPVISRSGEVLGGLFFGHANAGVFTERAEKLVSAIAGHASVAIDNSRLFRALNESEKKFRLMAEFIPDIVWTAGSDGTVDYVNQQWPSYTGLSRETMSGFNDSIHPDDQEKLLSAWKDALVNCIEMECECRLRSKAGTYQWFLIKAIPYRDEEGNITKWIGTSTNIQEHKALQEKKDEFIGIASHELKTPLTSVKAYLQLLEAKEHDEETKRYIGKANQHVARLHNLISDLLDVSKIQAGKIQFNFGPVSIDKMIEEAIESIRHLHSTHEIILENENRDIMLDGDKQRLEQVLVNFLSNAIKYSPRANKVIVKAEQKDNEVIVSVQDFGIGIPAAKQSRIFERFFRVDESRPHITGLGIGLYIAAEIIRRHEGRVWVESEEEKGSSFYFALPIK